MWKGVSGGQDGAIAPDGGGGAPGGKEARPIRMRMRIRIKEIVKVTLLRSKPAVRWSYGGLKKGGGNE